MEDANLELLTRGLMAIGLEVPPVRLDALVAYHDFLMECNTKVNLTGLRDERDSVVGNLLNSLAPWRFVELGRRTADVGSGGGLPGLPLAIALDMPVVLIESRGRKCDFLRESAQRFAPRVRVVEADVNTVTEAFEQVVSIAYGSLAKLVRSTAGMREPGSRVLAWKGRIERIETELKELPARMRNWRIEPFDVPGLDAQRHLCIHEGS